MAEATILRQRRENWTKGGPLVTDLTEKEINALEDQAAATVGDPSPMGLWALATGTWILGAVIAAMAMTPMIAVMPILIGFAGVAQFIAGLYAYRRTDALSATAFCSLGAFYFVLGMVFALQANGALPAGGNTAIVLGFLFESFAWMALILAIAAASTNLILTVSFGALCVGYALIGIAFFAGTTGVVSAIGGWFLCGAAFFAYYVGGAVLLNSIWQRAFVPVGPRMRPAVLPVR